MGVSDEINILARPEVIITSHRVIAGSATYAVRNITSTRSKVSVINQLIMPIYLIALVQIGFCFFLSCVFQTPLVFAICFILSFLLDLSILAFPIRPFYKKNIYYEILSITLAGALVGFLLKNKPPAKIFLGNGGSEFLGIFLSILTFHFLKYQAIYFYNFYLKNNGQNSLVLIHSYRKNQHI